MTLKANQPKTGHLDEDSPNTTKRTARPDGTGGGQKTAGHKSERDFPTGPNAEKRVRPFSGATGNTQRAITERALPETTRSDSAREIER